MVEYAKLRKEDIVLEVGAGLGHLTELLCKKVAKVYAVEIDPKLIEILQNRFIDTDNVDILAGDVLKLQLPNFNKIVSNPPYSISSPLIFKILQSKFEVGIMTLQKDFAGRLIANEGNKEYGRLTVMVTRKANVKVLEYVPSRVFYPAPKVESAIIEIVPFKDENTMVLNEEKFSEFMRVVFSQRNKKLRNGIISFLKNQHDINGKVENIIDGLPDMGERVYKISPRRLCALFNEIYERLTVTEHTKRL
jgi:16S rRNA (adenine1518-N6/adenine1519-N6)-dimethyltransferase